MYTYITQRYIMHVLRDPRIGCDCQALGWPYYSLQKEDHMLCSKMILYVHSPFQSVVYSRVSRIEPSLSCL